MTSINELNKLARALNDYASMREIKARLLMPVFNPALQIKFSVGWVNSEGPALAYQRPAVHPNSYFKPFGNNAREIWHDSRKHIRQLHFLYFPKGRIHYGRKQHD